MSIGKVLEQLRKSRGLKKVDVAKNLNMPYTTYNNYETDAREPGSDTLREISKFYHVSIDYLLENNDYEPTTIAAHHDGEWSEDELDEIEKFKEYVKSKREK